MRNKRIFTSRYFNISALMHIKKTLHLHKRQTTFLQIQQIYCFIRGEEL